MQSIYKKLVDDFTFLNIYGYFCTGIQKHYVMPSVIFQNEQIEIQIGYAFDETRFFINIMDTTIERYYVYDNHSHLLNDVVLIGDSYDRQLNQVREILRHYLQSNKSP